MAMTKKKSKQEIFIGINMLQTIFKTEKEDYTLILSDEGFAARFGYIGNTCITYYDALFESLSLLGIEEVEVIGFIREQTQLLESWWRQTVIGGGNARDIANPSLKSNAN